jgi:Fe-S cluster assembly protein SufB
VSKGISADQSKNTYRGLVKVLPGASNCRNYSICDSMLVGAECSANTVPYIEAANSTAVIEHEATTSKISEDQLFYIKSRGIDEESAINLVVNGFCKEVFKQLPMEFAIEATKLLEMKLEGSIG